MRCPIEHAHSKLWDKLEREFWCRMAEQAPNPQMRRLYAAKLGIDIQGQVVHAGVKGVTLMCPACYTKYDNVHPDTENHPSWCPCMAPPQKLRPISEVKGVAEVTTKFLVKRIVDGRFK